MLRLRVVLVFVLVQLSLAEVAAAKALPTCKGPRNAVESVFAWQAGKQQSLANATKCLEHGGRSQKALEEAARQLKTLFDAEGVIVQTEKLSDDSEFLDGDKNSRLVVTPRYPEVTVEKRDGKWVWTRESLDWIEERYDDRLGDFDRLIDAIPDPLRITYLGLALWQYVAFVLLLVAGALVSRLLRGLVGVWLRRTEPAADGARSLARRMLDRAAVPLGIGVSALVVRLLYPELRLPVAVAAGLHLGVRLMWTVAAVVAAFRFADVVADGIAQRAERAESRLDDHLVPILRKSLKGGSLFVGAMLLLQNLSIDVTALFATLGIGTLAVGLAAKDALANLFGSISIFIDNPFKIGDWIFVDGADGIVEEVGFRSTRIRTQHNSVVILPNAKLADAKIDNYGKRRFRRAIVTLHLVHGTPPERCDALCAAIRRLIEAHPHVRREKIDVVLTNIMAPAIELTATFFFPAEAEVDEPSERHRLLLATLEEVRAAGVTLHAPPAASPAAKPAQVS